MKENDNVELREELFEKMKEIEDKFVKFFDSKESYINKEINNLNSKIKETIEKSSVTIENYSSQKIDHEKILELEKFKNRVDSMLITHEVRINKNINELVKIQSKYDKVIVDNLLVPGYIGPSCQFKNIGNYISTNIIDMTKFKLEKEQIKKDTKDYKNKIDTIMKQMVTLNDSSIERCIEYMDTKRKDIEKSLDGKITLFNDKVNEIKMLFSLFQNKIDEQLNNFKSEIEKTLNLKDEMIKIMDEKNKDINKFINTVHKKVVINIKDIGILKKKVNEVHELNKYYTKNYKKDNSKEKEVAKTIQGVYQSNTLNITKAFNFNSLLSNNRNKNSEFIALNYDSSPEDLLKNNIQTINNLNSTKIKSMKDNGQMLDIKMVDLFNKESTIKSEITAKPKNFFLQNSNNNRYKLQKKENKKIIGSFDNLLMESNLIPLLTDPIILDQKILNDADLKATKEKKNVKIEILKKNFHKNLMNLRAISGSNPLDLYNYSTSVPKLSLNPQKDRNKKLKTRKTYNELEELRTKQIKSKILDNLNDDKANLKTNKNNYKIINLELEENMSINPDTNNGAYIIAHKQEQNSNISNLKNTPTSFVNIYNVSQRSSTLMNMTFAKEDKSTIKNSFNKTTYNDFNKYNKNRFNIERNESSKYFKLHKDKEK